MPDITALSVAESHQAATDRHRNTIKADAVAVGAAEEARIRTEFVITGTVAEPSRTVTVRDCIAAYKSRPGGLYPFDVRRLDELDADIGDTLLPGTREAWGA
jgi:hypothetical protein